MGAKGNCCCCDPCETKPGCGCCACLPTRICVRLFSDDAYAALAATEAVWDCVEQAYVGELGCGGELIDFRIDFERVGENCFICFHSYILGHEEDTRVCLPMGGRTDCRGLSFSFPVDLTNVPYCSDSGSGTVEIEPGDYISRRPICGDCPDCKCWCRCICIDYSIDQEESVRTSVCWDEEYGWVVDVADGTLTLSLVCNEETGVTGLLLETDFATSGAGLKVITCPDDLDADWILSLSGNRQAILSVRCEGCPGCCPNPQFFLDLTWDFADLDTVSSFSGEIELDDGPAGVFTVSGVDSQGHAWEATLTLPEGGGTVQCRVVIQVPDGPWVLEGEGDLWSGRGPHSGGPFPMEITDPTLAGGSANFSYIATCDNVA